MLLARDPATLDRDDAVAAAVGAELAKRLLDAYQLRCLASAAGSRRQPGDVSEVGQELSAATNMQHTSASCRTDLGCSAVTRLPAHPRPSGGRPVHVAARRAGRTRHPRLDGRAGPPGRPATPGPAGAAQAEAGRGDQPDRPRPPGPQNRTGHLGPGGGLLDRRPGRHRRPWRAGTDRPRRDHQSRRGLSRRPEPARRMPHVEPAPLRRRPRLGPHRPRPPHRRTPHPPRGHRHQHHHGHGHGRRHQLGHGQGHDHRSPDHRSPATEPTSGAPTGGATTAAGTDDATNTSHGGCTTTTPTHRRPPAAWRFRGAAAPAAGPVRRSSRST